MEFWEGAVLALGGLWLVGRMSRASASSPLNRPPVSQAALGTVGPAGNTVATNTDGSDTLVAGEPLTPQGPTLNVPRVLSSNPVHALPFRTPITSTSPIARNRVLNL